MFCTQCGKELVEGVSFCSACGNAVRKPVVEVAAEPAPVIETPAPVIETPAPVIETPAPVIETPAPAYEEPAPAYEAPAPAYEAPAPAYEASAPAYEAPAPAYQAPAYEAPAPAYQAPAYQAPAYAASAPAYNMAAPTIQTNWKNSSFDGGLWGLIGINLLTALLTSITFGFAYPAMFCFKLRWVYRHSIVGGYRLKFNGTGGQLFGKYILWTFLSIITFGIFALWLPIKYKKWEMKHVEIDSVIPQ